MKIVLMACASKKLPLTVKAKELYISPLFKLNLKYAKSLKPDKIFVLSAKYGLINLEEEIEPYNKTLNNFSDGEIKIWAKEIISKLKEATDLEKDEFIFLAGEKYRRHLIPYLKIHKIPLKGLGIGKQLKYLKENSGCSGKCEELHNLFNIMERLAFPFKEEKIPSNGIYILFEKGEKGHGGDRIVRIGTHTGKDQLRSRINQHFINENKDRSIFRKNIGRALLNKQKDPYLKIWDLDLTTREAKEKFGKLIDKEKQKQVEGQITKHLQDSFSFVAFSIDDKDNRLEFESKIISTISLCKDCKSSEKWLGNHSPKQKIKESGLWLVNELYKNQLSKQDLKKLQKYLSKK